MRWGKPTSQQGNHTLAPPKTDNRDRRKHSWSAPLSSGVDLPLIDKTERDDHDPFEQGTARSAQAGSSEAI